jgi:hypothetical protein
VHYIPSHGEAKNMLVCQDLVFGSHLETLTPVLQSYQEEVGMV